MKTMEVFSKWNNILKEVEEQDKSVAYCLKKGYLSSIEGKKIIIEFDDFDKFHKKIAEKRKDIIQKAVRSVMDGNFKVELLIIENPNDGGLPF